MAGHRTFAVTVGGWRYVRVAIAPHLHGCDLAATVGHELRHAVEIAEAPVVIDQASMAMFHTSVGIPRRSSRPRTFNTADAVAAGDRIRRELLRGGRLDAPDRRP